MRHEPNLRIENYRVQNSPLGRSAPGRNWGVFQVGMLIIISSGGVDENPEGAGWEHVSVRHRDRIPTWEEMCQVKDLFWQDEECVIQFHPPKSVYYNKHPNVLHLWRRPGHEPELPPKELL